MYRVSEMLRSTHGPDGAILLDLERGRVLRLNTTGSHIFELLKRGESESQIVQALTRDFQVSNENATSDLIDFLQLLERKGLIQIAGGEAL